MNYLSRHCTLMAMSGGCTMEVTIMLLSCCIPQSLSLAGTATSIIFVATKVLSGQTRVCRDKTCILSRQNYVCCNKTFVATNIILSRQAYLCRDKHVFVATNICRDKHICVVTKVFYHGKHTFVAIKIISVPPPAIDAV